METRMGRLWQEVRFERLEKAVNVGECGGEGGKKFRESKKEAGGVDEEAV